MALIVSIFIVELLNVVVCFGRQDISDDAIMASPKAHFHGAACVQRMHHIWIHEQHLATMQWFRRQKLQEQFDRAAEQAKAVENPGSIGSLCYLT